MAISYEGFYDGAPSSLSSDHGEYFTGYKMSAGMLGFPGSPQTANQIEQTVNALKQGVKVFEVTMLTPETAETIPTQHFNEMRALMKLSGVKPSVHGPLIDAAGFTDKGWGGESGRIDNERRMFDAIEKAHVLDPSGNIPIVFHASNGAHGAEWKPGDEKKGESETIMERGVVINQETGQMQEVKRDFKFRPEIPGLLEKGGVIEGYDKNRQPIIKYIDGREPGRLFSAESNVDAMNDGEWSNRLNEIAQMGKHASEIIGTSHMNLAEYKNAVIATDGSTIKDLKTGENLPRFDSEGNQINSYNQMKKAGLFLQNAELSFNSTFHQAYKYGTTEQKKELKKLAEYYSSKRKEVDELVDMGGGKVGINIWSPVKRKELLDETINALQNIAARDGAPELFKFTDDLAMDKASITFGNLAKKSYDKFGESAPVLAIENMFQGMAFSRAEDLKKLVEKSRKNFVEQLVNDKGMVEKDAERIAKKHLGVTWDVGHLNLMKKKGFTDKDIIEQTKIIAQDKSMVKHIHLTDNFGYADTHLAPGMGNVPIKAILEELEKTGRFDEMKKITEAGGFVQHFKRSPHPMTLSAFGSGIYGMKAGPQWNQVMDVQGAYFGGYGTLNPTTHHTYFGAGFTTMPVELGGNMQGGQSRFGGTPMA